MDLQNMGKILNGSVLLINGGYLSGFDVHHDIQCLRRLWQFSHSNYYGNPTETNRNYLHEHLGKSATHPVLQVQLKGKYLKRILMKHCIHATALILSAAA